MLRRSSCTEETMEDTQKMMMMAQSGKWQDFFLDSCGKTFDHLLFGKGGSPETYYNMKRLRAHYDDKEDGYQDSACHLHGLTRASYSTHEMIK